MEISKDAFKAANRQASERLQNTSIATGARYDRSANRVVIALSSGIEVAFSPRHAQGIQRAKPHQLLIVRREKGEVGGDDGHGRLRVFGALGDRADLAKRREEC